MKYIILRSTLSGTGEEHFEGSTGGSDIAETEGNGSLLQQGDVLAHRGGR